jgi:hypothetical protein
MIRVRNQGRNAPFGGVDEEAALPPEKARHFKYLTQINNTG